METKKKNRNQYKRPQVSQVKLEIDEAVLTNCKVDAGLPGKGTRTCSHGPPCSSTTFGS